MRPAIWASLAVAMLSLSVSAQAAPSSGTADEESSTSSRTLQHQFMATLARHCGKAYAGRLISDPAKDADMAGKPMIMHVRNCSHDRIEIPFHIGGAGTDADWDRSRTWIIKPTSSGLSLKHDHRHADGTADAVTLYGGHTDRLGTAQKQSFPIDAETVALFQQHGLTASLTNIWEVELTDSGFTYGLHRDDRDFRVFFDFRQPVPPPPPAWGW